MDVKALEQAGVSYDRGVARCQGDAAAYEAMLASFLDDRSLETASDCITRREDAALLECLCGLREECTRLELLGLYEAVITLADRLQPVARCDEAEIRGEFAAFQHSYLLTRRLIRNALQA